MQHPYASSVVAERVGRCRLHVGRAQHPRAQSSTSQPPVAQTSGRLFRGPSRCAAMPATQQYGSSEDRRRKASTVERLEHCAVPTMAIPFELSTAQ